MMIRIICGFQVCQNVSFISCHKYDFFYLSNTWDDYQSILHCYTRGRKTQKIEIGGVGRNGYHPRNTDLLRCLTFNNTHNLITPHHSSDSSFTTATTSSCQPINITDNDKHVSLLQSHQGITNKLSTEDLTIFCEQLHSFTERVKNMQEIINVTYDTPSRLQEILDQEAMELDCLHCEIRHATNNIERIKTQRKAIRKEKYSTEKILKKIKDEEMHEMEAIISVYDKGMFSRWEIVKNTKKLEAVENFLYDIEGKLLAMRHLKVLASQKMNNVITWTIKSTKEKRTYKVNKKSLENKNKENTTKSCIGIEQKTANNNIKTTGTTMTTVQEQNSKGKRQQNQSQMIPNIFISPVENNIIAEFDNAIELNDNNTNQLLEHRDRLIELNNEMQNLIRQLMLSRVTSTTQQSNNTPTNPTLMTATTTATSTATTNTTTLNDDLNMIP